MQDEIKRDTEVKTVQPNSYTMTSMQLAKVVNVMYKIYGSHPTLGEVLDALIKDDQIHNSNPRAKGNPKAYWKRVAAKELREGGVLQYVS
jgi:hypothetical protein